MVIKGADGPTFSTVVQTGKVHDIFVCGTVSWFSNKQKLSEIKETAHLKQQHRKTAPHHYIIIIIILITTVLYFTTTAVLHQSVKKSTALQKAFPLFSVIVVS